MALKTLITEWRQALADEIKAVERRGRSGSSVTVRNGQLIGQVGNHFVYQFVLENPLNVPDDAPVKVKVGSESYDGTIVATVQFEITIAIEAHIGDFVPEATITTDATFLLKALSDQWGKVDAGELKLNEDLILKLLNLRSVTIKREKPSPLTPRIEELPNGLKDMRSADEDQREAASASLGNEITFIWGPPGTGKTTTLAWVAEAFLSRQMSVLVVAHTNVAVDRAILDIAKVLKGSYDADISNDFVHDKMFRFGTPQLNDVCPACKSKQREGEHSEICVAGIVRKRSESLQVERDTLTLQRERVAATLQGIRSDLALWQHLHEWEEYLRKLMTYLDDVQQNHRALASRLEQLTKQLSEVSEKLRETEHDMIDLQRKQTAAKAKLQEVSIDLALWQKLREAEERARKLANHLNAMQQKQTTLADRFAQLTTQLGEIAQRLKEAEQVGTLKRLLYRLDPKQLRAQHDQLASERRTVHESLTVTQRQVEDAKSMMRDSEQCLSHLQKQTQDVVDEASLRHNARVLEDGISRLDARIKEIERVRALNQAQHDRLASEQHNVRESLTATQHQMEDAALKKQDAERQLSVLRTTIARRQAEGMADEASLQRSAKDLEDEMSQLDTRLKEIDQRLASIEEEVLREARLIATTLTKAYLNKTVCARTFDAVIADEASMAAIPALCFSAGLSTRKVVIVGDFRQLAPIAIADDDKEPNELVRKWLRKDVFDQAGIIKVADEERYDQDGRLVPLTKQYRMHLSISQIPNRLIYKDLLDDQRSTDDNFNGLNNEPFPGEPLVLVDTSDVNPWCSHDPNYSRFNIYSAVVAAELARQVVDDDVNADDETKRVKVGVTTPYTIQAKLIGRILQSWGYSESDITVLNVHKFQGNERDVIIFDVADGPNLGIGKPLQGGFGSDAMRLVNVAITRPKSKLIVIANQSYCLPRLNAESTPGQVLELMAVKAQQVDSRDVIDSYFHPDVAAAEDMMRPKHFEMEDLSDITIVNDTQFYDLFLQDLARTQRRVVIFSPFAARRRIDKLDAHLRALIDGRKSVYIVTRPPSRQPTLFKDEAEEALDYLESIGVKVIRKAGRDMHEKIALIDDCIVWCGSLNIISQSSSSEMMLRFDSATFASEVNRLWGVDKLINEKETEKPRAENRERVRDKIGVHACPKCDKPMVVRFSKSGPFLSCHRYPECDGKANIKQRLLEEFIEEIIVLCPEHDCDGSMVLKRSRRGYFLSCEYYPDCRGTLPLSKLF